MTPAEFNSLTPEAQREHLAHLAHLPPSTTHKPWQMALVVVGVMAVVAILYWQGTAPGAASAASSTSNPGLQSLSAISHSSANQIATACLAIDSAASGGVNKGEFSRLVRDLHLAHSLARPLYAETSGAYYQARVGRLLALCLVTSALWEQHIKSEHVWISELTCDREGFALLLARAPSIDLTSTEAVSPYREIKSTEANLQRALGACSTEAGDIGQSLLRLSAR